MKKLIITSLMTFTLIFCNVNNAEAIERPYSVGTFLLSGHLGLTPNLGLNFTGDYVLVNQWWEGHFAVGGYAGFNTRNNDYYYSSNKYEQHYSNFSLLPRASYGLNITREFEVHGGLMLGLTFRSWEYRSIGEATYIDNDSDAILDGGIFLGCRYFFNRKWGASAELNFTRCCSYMNLGVTYKF